MNKDEILSAIRRITKENGGKPPGRVQFKRITGISEGTWSGRYWTRWGDALIEAGFIPNELSSSIPNDLLLEKFAALVSELKRIPTNPELRMRRRADPSFPSHNTFSRFGSKKHLLGALLTFCSESDEFRHLIAIIEKEPHALPSEKVESPESKSGEISYVYLMQFGKEYKIGNADNVERRFRELKTQMPYEGKIIHTIETGDPEGIEAYWHGYFAGKRLKGEWFALTASDIKYFKRRKLM
jgi:hypothetical protein